MTAIPKVVASFSTTLANKISSSATSMTLVTGTDDAGNSLSGTIGFVLDKGTASEEFVMGTVSGTSVTSMTRGLDPQNPSTEVSALKKEHRRGATVEITDYPVLGRMYRILNGDDNFPNNLDLNSKKITNLATPTVATDGATKGYVDGVAIAGGADASTTVKGLSKMSVAPVSATNPIAVGDNDNRVSPVSLAALTAGEVDALAGSSGTPSSTNKYITENDVSSAAASGKIVRATGTALPALSGANLTNLPGPSILARDPNTNTTSSTTEKTMATYSVPGGTLGTNRAIRVTFPVRSTMSGNTYSFDIKVKYGATTLITSTVTGQNSTNIDQAGLLQAVLYANGATNSQYATLALSMGGTATGSNTQYGGTATSGTAAEDSTATKTLSVTVTSGNASYTQTGYGSIIELI